MQERLTQKNVLFLDTNIGKFSQQKLVLIIILCNL